VLCSPYGVAVQVVVISTPPSATINQSKKVHRGDAYPYGGHTMVANPVFKPHPGKFLVPFAWYWPFRRPALCAWDGGGLGWPKGHP